MKHYYLRSVRLVAIMLSFFCISHFTQAQCNCSVGVPATETIYSFVLPVTNLPNATISFPQFDPSIGTLSCVTFNYDISGTSTTGVRNYASSTALLDPSNPDYSETGKLEYIFQLTTSANITGPGVSIVRPFNKMYGPDSLGAYGTPEDTITYGPDNIFANQTGTKSTTGLAAYQGIGAVNFSYGISGGLTTLKGGLNYNQKIVTDYEGSFILRYFWCANALLGSNITNFVVSKKEDDIQLNWSAVNQDKVNQYVVEYSTDGKNFIAETTVEGSKQVAGQYNFSHPINTAGNGYVYFRIKQIDESGKTSYSAIRTASLSTKAAIKITTYPNPATEGFNLSFDRLINGNFKVDLVSAAGQIVHSSRSRMNNANVLSIKWNEKPAPGIYFARVTNMANMQQELIKIVIR